MRVLVVDDSPDNVDAMALLLRLDGYDVTGAYCGPTALKLARAQQPDVVLLDISMPGMSGYEVARQLRQMFQDHVLLIAITSHGLEEDRRRSREAGFDRHLVKPVDPHVVEDLLATAESAL
jgi:CheY-like chemotaxis protein